MTYINKTLLLCMVTAFCNTFHSVTEVRIRDIQGEIIEEFQIDNFDQERFLFINFQCTRANRNSNRTCKASHFLDMIPSQALAAKMQKPDFEYLIFPCQGKGPVPHTYYKLPGDYSSLRRVYELQFIASKRDHLFVGTGTIRSADRHERLPIYQILFTPIIDPFPTLASPYFPNPIYLALCLELVKPDGSSLDPLDWEKLHNITTDKDIQWEDTKDLPHLGELNALCSTSRTLNPKRKLTDLLELDTEYHIIWAEFNLFYGKDSLWIEEEMYLEGPLALNRKNIYRILGRNFNVFLSKILISRIDYNSIGFKPNWMNLAPTSIVPRLKERYTVERLLGMENGVLTADQMDHISEVLMVSCYLNRNIDPFATEAINMSNGFVIDKVGSSFHVKRKECTRFEIISSHLNQEGHFVLGIMDPMFGELIIHNVELDGWDLDTKAGYISSIIHKDNENPYFLGENIDNQEDLIDLYLYILELLSGTCFILTQHGPRKSREKLPYVNIEYKYNFYYLGLKMKPDKYWDNYQKYFDFFKRYDLSHPWSWPRQRPEQLFTITFHEPQLPEA